jgi:hypothetical protein
VTGAAVGTAVRAAVAAVAGRSAVGRTVPGGHVVVVHVALLESVGVLRGFVAGPGALRVVCGAAIAGSAVCRRILPPMPPAVPVGR